MNQAHVFQEKYTGVQIFVYNCLDKYDAKLQFYKVVINHENWQYLGKKIAKQVQNIRNSFVCFCGRNEQLVASPEMVEQAQVRVLPKTTLLFLFKTFKLKYYESN